MTTRYFRIEIQVCQQQNNNLYIILFLQCSLLFCHIKLLYDTRVKSPNNYKMTGRNLWKYI